MTKRTRYQRRPVKFADISFRESPYVGFVWPLVSTRTREVYDVTMTENGFTCTCTGFAMHGKCKHITAVYGRLGEDAPQYQVVS
jgi:hypothetical protein